MRITMADVLSVAETLYMIAKQLNGLDENMISFLDLKGRAIAERQYFLDAAFVHALLTEGKVGKLPDRDRIVLMTRLCPLLQLHRDRTPKAGARRRTSTKTS